MTENYSSAPIRLRIEPKHVKDIKSYISQTNMGLADKAIYLFLKNRLGSVEHYFHFLLGFLVPLILEHKRIRNENNSCKIYVRSCSVMDRHISDINLKGIEIIGKNLFNSNKNRYDTDTNNAKIREYIECWGYDEPEYYDRNAFLSAKLLLTNCLSDDMEKYSSIFKEGQHQRSKNIVFINRKAPHPFYNSVECEIKSAGTDRRSIRNFNELSNAVISKYPNTLCVTLEEKSLAYQIALFKHADIIIAQHGAALANLIWCRPNTTLIEIWPLDMPKNVKNKGFFNKLAKCMNIKYCRVNQNHRHSDVDINLLLSAIQE